MCMKFRAFSKKIDEYQKLIISKIIDFQKCGYITV